MFGNSKLNSTITRRGSRANLSLRNGANANTSRYESQMNLDTRVIAVGGAAASHVSAQHNLDNIKQLMTLDILLKIDEENHLICGQLKKKFYAYVKHMKELKELHEKYLEMLQLCKLQQSFASMKAKKFAKETDKTQVLDQVNYIHDCLEKATINAKIDIDKLSTFKDSLSQEYNCQPNIALNCSTSKRLDSLVVNNDKLIHKLTDTIESSAFSFIDYNIKQFDSLELLK